jgi:hypothetical protein
MLTGRYPSRSIAATYRNYPFNLFTLLGGTYDLNVHETATQFCPPDRCRSADGPSAGQGGLGPVLRRSSALLGTLVSPSEAPAREPSADLDHKVAPAGTDAEGRPVSRPAGFREFLDGLRPSATPRLHFLHLVLPHRPWQFLPSGLRYPDPPQTYGMPFASAKWEAEPTWTRLGRQRHWLQTAYTDRLLGEVLGTLKDRGLLDQSIVIVTADHGVSFANGTQARVFGHGNAPWVMWVPLFIKAPGQQTGRVDDRNWEHVDLLPTVADAAGVTVPWETDGRSALRGPPRAAATKRFYAVREDRPPKVSTVDGRANLGIAMRGGGLPPHPEVRPRLGAEPGTGLDRLVPRPDLVGRAVDSMTVTAGGPAVTVDQLATFGQSAAGRDKLPAFVHGTAPAGLAPGTLLAVALNGRIGTVATVAPEGRQRRLRFGGMLPAGLFEADSNRLELFVVEGAERLRRLSLKSA